MPPKVRQIFVAIAIAAIPILILAIIKEPGIFWIFVPQNSIEAACCGAELLPVIVIVTSYFVIKRRKENTPDKESITTLKLGD